MEIDTSETVREEAFERITRLVRHIFSVDIAAVSLIDGARQQFQSIQGLVLDDIPLEQSFCRAPWREGVPIVICDATKDDEFHNHPLVLDEPYLRAYAGVPLKTSAGQIIGTICAIHRTPRPFTERDMVVLSDLAQIAVGELELRQHANVDALTDVLTRRTFLEESRRLRAWSHRKQFEISFIMFDVDHFKTINDRFGHAAGDDVLKSIATACRANLRDTDILGRLGGEEFAVALEGDAEKARVAAERLRTAIAGLQFTFAETELFVTASFGVADLLSRDEPLDAVLNRADAALYAAKTRGRNRTVIAQHSIRSIN